jgi:hypothetical protein
MKHACDRDDGAGTPGEEYEVLFTTPNVYRGDCCLAHNSADSAIDYVVGTSAGTRRRRWNLRLSNAGH